MIVEIILGICSLGFLIGFIDMILLSNWRIHKNITKKYSDIYGPITYENFVKEFEKINWKRVNSEELVSENSRMGIVIFKINGSNMLFNSPVDYWLAKNLVSRYAKQQTYKNYVKNLWEEDENSD